MKKLLIILIVLFPFFSFAQWHKSTLQPGLSIKDVSYLNADTLLIVDANGLWRSFDKGKTVEWVCQMVAAGTIVYKSFDTIMLTKTGASGILESYDAGVTWNIHSLILSNGDTAFKKKPITVLRFFDQSNGIVIGDTVNGSRQVFLTHDGGLSWNFISNPSISRYNTSKIDILVSTVFEGGKLKRMVDGRILTISNFGQYWEIDTTSELFIRNVAFKDEREGLAYARNKKGSTDLYKTPDGGVTWSILGDTSLSIYGVLSYVKGTAQKPGFFIHNKNRKCYYSYDNGTTWQVNTTDTISYYDFYFYNAESGLTQDIGFPDPPIVYYYEPMNVGLMILHKTGGTALHCYPNPAGDFLNLPMVYQSVEFWNIEGKQAGSFSQTNRIDISGFSTGLFIIKATDKNGSICTQKVLIQH